MGRVNDLRPSIRRDQSLTHDADDYRQKHATCFMLFSPKQLTRIKLAP